MQETNSDLFPATIRLSISAGQLTLEDPVDTSAQGRLRPGKKSGALGRRGKCSHPPLWLGHLHILEAMTATSMPWMSGQGRKHGDSRPPSSSIVPPLLTAELSASATITELRMR